MDRLGAASSAAMAIVERVVMRWFFMLIFVEMAGLELRNRRIREVRVECYDHWTWTRKPPAPNDGLVVTLGTAVDFRKWHREIEVRAFGSVALVAHLGD